MLSDAFLKEIHGTELMWKLLHLKNKYHAVILADIRYGVSIKPYFEDDDERERFILDVMEASLNRYMPLTREDVIKIITNPTYCFCQAKLNADEDQLTSMILNEGPPAGFISRQAPVCQFA